MINEKNTVTKNEAGEITGINLVNPGQGYISKPEFDLTLGLSGAIIDHNRRRAAEMAEASKEKPPA